MASSKKPPTVEQLETWADDAAAVGNSSKLRKRANFTGFRGSGHANAALRYRATAIDDRLAGRIASANKYESSSEHEIKTYALKRKAARLLDTPAGRARVAHEMKRGEAAVRKREERRRLREALKGK